MSFIKDPVTKDSRRLSLLMVALITSAFIIFRATAFAADAPNPHEVPSIDGGLGPCSIEFTVKDAANTPLYNAKIRVHIATGVLGIKKTDLEVGTNVDGKGKFTGLPDKTKFPLEFNAQQGDLAGTSTFTPSKGCTPRQESMSLKNSKN
jgi:hypothetical protein